MAKKTSDKTYDRVGPVTAKDIGEMVTSVSRSLVLLRACKHAMEEESVSSVMIDGPGIANTASTNARKLAKKVVSGLADLGITPKFPDKGEDAAEATKPKKRGA